MHIYTCIIIWFNALSHRRVRVSYRTIQVVGEIGKSFLVHAKVLVVCNSIFKFDFSNQLYMKNKPNFFNTANLLTFNSAKNRVRKKYHSSFVRSQTGCKQTILRYVINTTIPGENSLFLLVWQAKALPKLFPSLYVRLHRQLKNKMKAAAILSRLHAPLLICNVLFV